MSILDIKDLRGGYVADIEILQGISFSMQVGEAIGIIGLNGSGKSTLGKAVMNMLPLRQGDICFEGKSVVDLSTSDLSRQGIAIMQQGGKVFPNLSVWENLQLAFGDKMDHTHLATLTQQIPLLNMPPKKQKNTMADKLSGGQRHQLALAMTLAQQPRLVILDEPSAGLSPRAVEEIYELLSTLRQSLGLSILLIEQNISKAITFCDRSLLLAQGNIHHEFTNSDISQIECLMFKK